MELFWYGAVSIIFLFQRSASVTHKIDKSALLIVDVQDCFLSNGSLEVPQADEIIPVINRIRTEHGGLFDVTVLTKDYHCPVHVSFASAHTGHKAQDVVQLTYTDRGELCQTKRKWKIPNTLRCPPEIKTRKLDQNLWPDHCVMNVTSGPASSEISSRLIMKSDDFIILKGTNCQIDSYSAFHDNGGYTSTELDTILRSRGINTIFVAGLALDYCVYYSARDAVHLNYTVYVILDATRSITMRTHEMVLADMDSLGINMILSDDLGRMTQNIQPKIISETNSSPIFHLNIVLCVVILVWYIQYEL